MPQMQCIRGPGNTRDPEQACGIGLKRMRPFTDIDISNHAVMNIAAKDGNTRSVKKNGFNGFVSIQRRGKLFDIREGVNMMAHIVTIGEIHPLTRSGQ